MFANIYLNKVDQYIKHKLHCKYYFRYMDDSIILVKTKEEAKEKLEKIRKFLKDNLYLELCGHIGYMKIANTKNLTDKLFYKMG